MEIKLKTTTPVKMSNTKENLNGTSLKHGYLLKQSEVLKQWHLRYFVLSKECLCYYRTEQESLESAPKEVIFFNDMSLYIDDLPDKQTKYCLKLVKRSLTPKITARTFFLCCFSEHERNEWLSQILQAKAIALVVDPATWLGNQEASAKDMNFELVNTTGSSVKLASAKELIQKCRRKISSGGSTRRNSPSMVFLDDFSINKRRKSTSCLSQEWRNTLMAI